MLQVYDRTMHSESQLHIYDEDDYLASTLTVFALAFFHSFVHIYV